jgi:hypothetical protein
MSLLDGVIFDLIALIAAGAYIYAVMHNFDERRLLVIGATVGLGIWGNLKQNGSKPSSPS